MKIGIISLQKDHTRLKYFDDHLSTFDNYYCPSAIDGKRLLAADYFKYCKNFDYFFNRRSILTPGEVGCKLSHLQIISFFIETSNEDDIFFIFEDDINFRYPTTILNKLNSFLKTQESPTVLHLGGDNGLKNSKRLIKLKHLPLHNNLPTIYDIHPITLRWLYRTAGYAINYSAAKILQSSYEKNNISADNWNYIKKHNKSLKFYYVDIISHPENLNNSSIESERCS